MSQTMIDKLWDCFDWTSVESCDHFERFTGDAR